MLELDAKRKWCPFSMTPVHMTSANRAGQGVPEVTHTHTRCLANDCAVWVVDEYDVPAQDCHGHCGLINQGKKA